MGKILDETLLYISATPLCSVGMGGLVAV